MQHDIINNMRIDMDQERVRSSISVRQGDTKTRVIHFTLTKAGKIVDLSNVRAVSINIVKPDGNICYNDCVICGSEIQYTITNQTINVCGECNCEIQIIYDDMSMITTPGFYIYVYNKNINQKALESQNEYTLLVDKAKEAVKYSEQAEALKEAAETAEQNASTSAAAAEESEANAKASELAAAESEKKAKDSNLQQEHRKRMQRNRNTHHCCQQRMRRSRPE